MEELTAGSEADCSLTCCVHPGILREFLKKIIIHASYCFRITPGLSELQMDKISLKRAQIINKEN